MTLFSNLQAGQSQGGTVKQISPFAWRLSLPAGPAGTYRWAQLDDYRHLSRYDFSMQVGIRLRMQMRVSSAEIPGTWGFGLWNDPFSFNLGLGGMARRFPALPNTAWFFNASPPNWLTLRNDRPADGFLAATFSSPPIPAWFLAPASLGLPLTFLPCTSGLFRRLARILISEDAARVNINVIDWHVYEIEWLPGGVHFRVDDDTCFSTNISPIGRLGLVLWIDNQYLRWNEGERLNSGTLACKEETWLEVRELEKMEVG